MQSYVTCRPRPCYLWDFQFPLVWEEEVTGTQTAWSSSFVASCWVSLSAGTENCLLHQQKAIALLKALFSCWFRKPCWSGASQSCCWELAMPSHKTFPRVCIVLCITTKYSVVCKSDFFSISIFLKTTNIYPYIEEFGSFILVSPKLLYFLHNNFSFTFKMYWLDSI